MRSIDGEQEPLISSDPIVPVLPDTLNDCYFELNSVTKELSNQRISYHRRTVLTAKVDRLLDRINEIKEKANG